MLDVLDVAKVYRGSARGVDDVTMRLGPGWSACSARTAPGNRRWWGSPRRWPSRPADRCCSTAPAPVRPGVTGLPAAVKGIPARTARPRIGELLELVDPPTWTGGHWASNPAECCTRSGSPRPCCPIAAAGWV